MKANDFQKNCTPDIPCNTCTMQYLNTLYFTPDNQIVRYTCIAIREPFIYFNQHTSRLNALTNDVGGFNDVERRENDNGL